MSAVAEPVHQRLIDSLALKALITAVVCVVVIPAAPLGLVLGVISFVRERHRVISGIAVVLGALETALLAAILLIPNGCGPTKLMNESAAAMTLRSGILPAMIQFQGGTYRDEDADGVGEHGFPVEMSGGQDAQQGQSGPAFLPSGLAGVRTAVNGYRFIVYLPDGAGVAVERAAITDHSPAAIDARERYWIAYAWPEQWGTTGTRMFCIDAQGKVWCTQPATEGGEPRWDSALSKGWGSEPAPGWAIWKK